MAEMKFFNYAKSVADAEAIIGARQKNAINAYKLEEAENVLKKRKEREQIMRQHADTPARIEALVDAGEYEGAKELAENYYAIDTARLEAMKLTAEGLNKDNWDDYRYKAIHQQGVPPEEIPEDYDPGWMNGQIKQVQQEIKTVTQILGPIGPEGQVMAQDITRAEGEITRGQPYDYAETKRRATGATGPKAADANAIRNAVRAAFGSVIDPVTNQPTILDPETEAKVAGVQSYAQALFDNGMNHLKAVEVALEAFGRPVQKQKGARDSAGIRGAPPRPQ